MSSTATTPSEARRFTGGSVFIVGAANSAGQAAVHLARYAADVTLVCRGDALSQHVAVPVDEIQGKENIHVRLGTHVVEAHGDRRLERVTLRGPEGDETVDARGLFILIGAEPRADWLPTEIERDERGFVVAGPTYETSVAGIFAIGDLRADSVKRVASAVGEGSVVIQHVHRYLAVRRGARARGLSGAQLEMSAHSGESSSAVCSSPPTSAS